MTIKCKIKVLLLLLVVSIGSCATAIGTMVLGDIWHDRQYRIVLTGPGNLHRHWEPYRAAGNPVFRTVPQRTRAKVLRIRYGKDYQAVRVEMEDGTNGWLFRGESRFDLI